MAKSPAPATNPGPPIPKVGDLLVNPLSADESKWLRADPPEDLSPLDAIGKLGIIKQIGKGKLSAAVQKMYDLLFPDNPADYKPLAVFTAWNRGSGYVISVDALGSPVTARGVYRGMNGQCCIIVWKL